MSLSFSQARLGLAFLSLIPSSSTAFLLSQSWKRAMSYISIKHQFVVCLAVLSLTGCRSTENGTWKSWFAQRPDGEETSTQGTDALRPSAADEEIAASAPPGKNATPKVPIAAERVDILLSQGHQAILEGRHDDARSAFVEVLAADPNNAKAHHGIAIIADISKDWSTAELHYRQALKQSPRDANLLNDIGYSYYLQNRFHDAESFLNQAAAIQPEHQTVQINLARLALRQGNRAGAEERLMTLFPAAEARSRLTMLENQLRESQTDLALSSSTNPNPSAERSSVSTGVNELSTARGAAEAQIPPNATLEEIQKLAEFRRLEAEQQRLGREMNSGSASLGTPIPLGPGANMNSMPSVAGSGTPAPDPIVQPAFITAQAPVQTTSYPGNQNGMQVHPAGHDSSAGVPMAGVPAAGMHSQPQGYGLGQPIAAPVTVQPTGFYQSAGHNSQPGGTNQHGGTNQIPAANQMPLVGLNAGPGALFPVNGSSNPAQTNGMHYAPNGMIPNNMNSNGMNPNGINPNAMNPNQQTGWSPGGSPAVGGTPATAGQPMPGLPTTGGMNTIGNSQYPSMPGPVSNPNLLPPQYSIPVQDWARQQQAYAQQINQQMRPAGADGQVSAPNPLQAYQQQLQSEQSLNQSLDRMNRQSSIAPVQAQY